VLVSHYLLGNADMTWQVIDFMTCSMEDGAVNSATTHRSNRQTDQHAVGTIWCNLLLITTGLVAVFSALIITVQWVYRDLFNWIVLGQTEEPTYISGGAREYLHFTYAILAATIIGWMVLMAFVIHVPLRRGEPWAWWGISCSVLAWFVIDSTASVAIGYPRNVVFNALFLASFALPLIATRSARVAQGARSDR
jgi:hypothetical protein